MENLHEEHIQWLLQVALQSVPQCNRHTEDEVAAWLQSFSYFTAVVLQDSQVVPTMTLGENLGDSKTQSEGSIRL